MTNDIRVGPSAAPQPAQQQPVANEPSPKERLISKIGEKALQWVKNVYFVTNEKNEVERIRYWSVGFTVLAVFLTPAILMKSALLIAMAVSLAFLCSVGPKSIAMAEKAEKV